MEEIELLIIETSTNMEKQIDFYEKEISKIRTRRVNPNILDNLKVECYGNIEPLKAIAAIKVIESKQLFVAPYDRNLMKSCFETLKKFNLNAQLKVESEGIRLIFPDLTEELRKKMIITVKKITEEFRIKIRNVRRDALHKLKNFEISEDLKKMKTEVIQKITDEKIAIINKIEKAKEHDLLKI